MGENNLSKLTKACLLGIFTFDISKSHRLICPIVTALSFAMRINLFNDALSNKKQTIEDTLPKIP